MKKIALLAFALASSLLLANCAGTNITAQVAAVEQEVQADASLVCGFIPTVATIAAFIPGANAVAPAAASIAEAICAAISKAPPVLVSSARFRSAKLGGAGGAPVAVAVVPLPDGRNVMIQGQFVR